MGRDCFSAHKQQQGEGRHHRLRMGRQLQPARAVYDDGQGSSLGRRSTRFGPGVLEQGIQQTREQP